MTRESLLGNFLMAAGFMLLATPLCAAEIALDLEQKFQTISGWETTTDLVDTPATPPWQPYRASQLDRVATEIGINRIRLEVRSGAETDTDSNTRFIAGGSRYEEWKKGFYRVVNDNDDPFEINWSGFDFAELDWHVENTVLPLRERLRRRNEHLIVNLCYVSFGKTPSPHEEPEEYAEFVLATYLHLQTKYGFTPDLWEVVLEPDHRNSRWTGRQLGLFMAATSARLRANGWTPAFVAPSVTNMKNAVHYVEEISNIPGAMNDFVELSYHRYGGRKPQILREIAVVAARHGLRTSMLEWWNDRNDHHTLYEDLVVGNISAWQGRVLNGLHEKSGAPTWTLKPRPDVRYTLQYTRDIRHGAVRIGATSDDPAFAPVAFVNTNGRHVVVIKAGQAGGFTVKGLPQGQYRVSYALALTTFAEPHPVQVGKDGRLTTAIPNKGVLTITQQ